MGISGRLVTLLIEDFFDPFLLAKVNVCILIGLQLYVCDCVRACVLPRAASYLSDYCAYLVHFPCTISSANRSPAIVIRLMSARVMIDVLSLHKLFFFYKCY